MTSADLNARKAAIARELAEAREGLLAAVRLVDEAAWEMPTANEGWSVRDVLAHVASGETTIQALLRRMADGRGGVPDDFDLDRYNASQLRRRAEQTVPQLLAELDVARGQTLEALAAATAQALSQRGRHPRGMITTLEETFRIIARHDREHTQDIRAAIENYSPLVIRHSYRALRP
jgi:uncharacterized protein (TIGR03083 family)